MRSETKAIVCALRNHGEHGAIVRLVTPDHGLVAAYVRGARGKRMRPVLRSHQPHYRTMLAVVAESADDGLGVEAHQPRGWK